MTDGEPILNRISRDAADLLQRHIREAAGREVFFAGVLDDHAKVCEVRPLARGNAEAVPALFAQLQLREVVLHNHPSGDLTPSDADLELAQMYSARGHGVYILDNEATLVYVVVEPFISKKIVPLNGRALTRAFEENSPLARSIPEFELRPQQIAMAEAIVGAFNRNGIAVIEAPTGVGKTMAYLLPAIRWAVSNKERIVISTRTINLQEQIIHHDLPLLLRCMEEKFHACLVKGRGNYLCKRKLERAFSEISLFDDQKDAEQLRAVAEWAEETRDGSRSDLHFMADRSIWERVNCEVDLCAGAQCRHFRECFLTRARREMAGADLLITNHHMLFSDIALKKEIDDFSGAAVLPAFSRVILDEAHSIEDAATEYFGLSANRYALHRVMRQLLYEEEGRERGLLPYLKLKLMRKCPQIDSEEYESYVAFIEQELRPALFLAADALDDVFTGLREYTAAVCSQIGRDIKWRLTPDILSSPELRQLHDETVMPAVNQARALIRRLEKLLDRLLRVKPIEYQDESPVQMEAMELAACIRRIEAVVAALAECTGETLEDNTVRWIEIDARNENSVRVARCPLEVGKPLAEWVYANLHTVVMTSATLAVGRRFDYFNNRVGLDLVDANRVHALLLDSPFDFSRQARVCVPTDGHDPNAPEYLEEMCARIRNVLNITRGHAFVLFTSFYALDFVFKKLEDELRAQHITPLCQGRAARSRLLEQFRREPESVLFATDSFWEGVDVAGDALQCVILARLPFRVPSEPILEARAEAITQAGGNAFMQYSVPQAIIKLRQGFGRLIRRRTDRGVVVILDNRVVTKYYGRAFLSSLPDAPLIKGRADDVWRQLELFFSER